MTFTASSVLKKLLILFLVIAGLHYAKEFLIPLAIGGVLASLFLPFCRWMENKKVPRILAAFICVFILLLAIAGIGALLGWQISALLNDIGLIKQKLIEVASHVQQYFLDHFGVSVEDQAVLMKEQQSSIGGIVQSIAGSLSSIISGSILVLVYIMLLLYYRVHIKNFMLKLFPPSQQEEMGNVISSAAYVSQQYLVGLAKMIGCLWVMYSIGFAIVGVKNPIFFAVLCGLLEIVPFIGNITGTSLTVLVSSVNGATLPMIGGVVLTYGIVQLIQGWVLEPLILGPQVKINPLFTILALVLGQLIWGIPGIVLAIPLTAMFKIVCDYVEPLKPLGFLIGEIETENTESGFIKKIKSWFKKG